MHNFMRFFYQNKSRIIKGAAIIIFIFLIIQVSNYFVKRSNEKELTRKEQQSNITTKSEETQGLVSEKSAVTGRDVPKEQLRSETDVINQFIDFCNQQDILYRCVHLRHQSRKQEYRSVNNP